MRIYIFTKKTDYFKVVGLLCDEIHREIEVIDITVCQLTDTFDPCNTDIIIIDDRLYDLLSEKSLYVLEKHQVKIVVLLEDKMKIKRYLSLNVIDYFVSPLNWNDVDHRLREAYHDYLALKKRGDHHLSDKLVIKTSNEIFAIHYNDILFLEKNHKVTNIHTRKKIYKCHDSLKCLLVKLPDDFVRIHSSYVVNFRNAKSFMDIGNRTYRVLFDNYHDCAVMSRKKSEELLGFALEYYHMRFIGSSKKG